MRFGALVDDITREARVVDDVKSLALISVRRSVVMNSNSVRMAHHAEELEFEG